jgi:hypothetical protein
MSTNIPMDTSAQEEIRTLSIRKEIEIDAPIEICFASVLEELGPGSQMPDGTPFHMKIEAWPGGRWYRDLGNNTGHFWAHVQVIKPPSLLELSGPMFMSYPATNFVQYRLTASGERTRLTVVHRAMGVIPPNIVKACSTDGSTACDAFVRLPTGNDRPRRGSERKAPFPLSRCALAANSGGRPNATPFRLHEHAYTLNRCYGPCRTNGKQGHAYRRQCDARSGVGAPPLPIRNVCVHEGGGCAWASRTGCVSRSRCALA